MQTISLLPGTVHVHQGQKVRLIRSFDLQHVIAEYVATGAVDRFAISSLHPLPSDADATEPITGPYDDVLTIPDKAWSKAQHKLEILRPVLEDRGNAELVEEIARRHQVSSGTIYRWMRAYDTSGSVLSLVERPHSGGKGKGRLTVQQDEILRQTIDTEYKTTQKKSVVKVYLAIQLQCRQAGITPPGINTLRRRIQQISEEEKMRTRWSKRMARDNFEPIKGEFPGADFPLAVAQIDHTTVDLILVDETFRQPVGRPYLTAIVDVYSRMVMGFYVSFDPPGAVGTGLCLAHAILPKENWLSRMNVQGDWPCWGIPSCINTDNAREFKGKMLARACEKYNIRLDRRPVKTPHFSGHIERAFRTFMKETHALRGTTFSNTKDRKEYDSEKEAVLTLREYEHWLTIFIVDIYHKRLHEGIIQVPYERYREGIFGTPTQPGTGLPERLYDELQVRLDFMPIEERTIQEYGVVIDHVHYYADVLRPYINSLEVGSGKRRLKRMFTFRRDPRDISCLYFLDPTTNQYHRIPYRNSSHPAISVWEFRQAWSLARSKGLAKVNEDAIFNAFEQMRAIELEAVASTKKLNKTRNRLTQGVPSTATAAFFQNAAANTGSTYPAATAAADNVAVVAVEPAEMTPPVLAPITLLPFDGLHDDASFAPEYS